MYVQFNLPNGAGGMAAGHALSIIRREIEQWSTQYNIPFRTKLVKYTFRLCLERQQDYVMFQLSWNPKNVWAKNYQLVETES